MTGPTVRNRLGDTISPYLLQHKDNPVHWFPWGDDALRQARQRDLPILLSIGYAACHWCHVMAHESFEDESTAALMNEHFINIKVDREERPDIDHLYMSALHAFGEQGGWPLTVFLTPDGKPFWGGTYFPPTARYGRPGFKDVLLAISTAWHERRFALESSGTEIITQLARPLAASTVPLDQKFLQQAATRLLNVMDQIQGGTKGAPKFPNVPLLEFLEQAHHASGNPDFVQPVDLTLQKLCLGGIYDHIGGGLCRYSTDELWLVPHFEKMLYDNALFVDLLTHAFQRRPHPLYRRRVYETIAWMIRDLKSQRPAFAASVDADSADGEGSFYVWTPSEVQALLGADAANFCALYDISESGNWENRSIPNLLSAHGDHIADESIIAPHLQRLRVSRETSRAIPATDDKILADWNGLAVTALARASHIFGEPDWLKLARDIFHFLTESMLLVPTPCHTHRQGRQGTPATASDFAFAAEAALAIYQATGEEFYIGAASNLLRQLDISYRDPDNGLYTVAASTTADLPARLISTLDEAIPNHHGRSINAMIRLYHYTGDSIWRDRADQLLAALAGVIPQNIFGHASLLTALDLRLNTIQLVLLGEKNLPGYTDFLTEIHRLPLRQTIFQQIADTATLPAYHPAAGKEAVEGKLTAYLCLAERCSLPIMTADKLIPTFNAMIAA